MTHFIHQENFAHSARYSKNQFSLNNIIILVGLWGWPRHGDPVVVGPPASHFVCNTDPSKLHQNGYFDKVIPLETLGMVVEEVDTFPMDSWYPIFQKDPAVQRGFGTGDRRILSLRVLGVQSDTQ